MILMMWFQQWLEENNLVQHAYKAWHKEKYYRNEHKDYMVVQTTRWGREMLDLYTKWFDHYDIMQVLENKWWILLCESESDIINQCKICFEYDIHCEFYKYNLEELWEQI